jgi:hypothetical protein
MRRRDRCAVVTDALTAADDLSTNGQDDGATADRFEFDDHR